MGIKQLKTLSALIALSLGSPHAVALCQGLRTDLGTGSEQCQQRPHWLPGPCVSVTCVIPWPQECADG